MRVQRHQGGFERRETVMVVQRVKQRELRGAAQPRADVLGGGRQLEQQQAADGAVLRGGLRGAGVEHADADALGLVDERRVRLDRAGRAGQLHDARRVLVRPGGQPAALDVDGDRGELLAELRRQALLERLEVLVLVDGTPVPVLGAEGDAQVRGKGVEVPRARRDPHPAGGRQLAAQRVAQRLPAGGQPLQDGCRGVRHRGECPPLLLGQPAQQRGDELEP